MIVPTGRGEAIMSELISKEDYEEILEWHYQMEKQETEMLVRPTCAPHYYRVRLQKMKEEGEKFQPRSLTFSTGGGKGCICAQSDLLHRLEGERPAVLLFPRGGGNVKQQKFGRSGTIGAVRVAARLREVQGRCGECEYINVCGGCRARADAVSRTISRRSRSATTSRSRPASAWPRRSRPEILQITDLEVDMTEFRFLKACRREPVDVTPCGSCGRRAATSPSTRRSAGTIPS